ncbi:hypothetical protein SLEP1_g28124 [Rubroshorea leprosula]|uniref:CG-1 domain-containing protein n=2 Tax=Rubroshorea leprosula TaxID=152421 RepID=A0AAV5K548_9ROSI|nr:hypothetical protein SLEP1_g28124 [Rubroshorea leprosula]
MESGFDINKLFREAQTRWLKPAEVHFILQNHEKYQIIHEPPQKPSSGSVLLFNKRVNRFFRKDGHSWRKKKDGRTVGEAHERLKVGNVETLNCYYAHGEHNPNFQRRSYWMLDPAHDHIVLVHYREINEGKPSPGSMEKSPGLSSVFSPSPKPYTSQNSGSNYQTSDVHEPSQNFLSPGYVEVSSDLGLKNRGVDSPEKHTSSADLDVSQALRRIEEQLSLDEDNTKDIGPFYIEDGDANDLDILEYGKEIPKQQPLHGPDYTLQGQIYTGYTGLENYPNNFVLPSDRGETEEHYQRDRNDYADGSEDTLYWKNVLESCEISLDVESQENLQSFPRRKALEQLELFYWSNFKGSNDFMLPHEVENVETAAHSSVMEALETNSIYCRMLFNQGQIGTPLATDSNITIAEKQKFTIREISPDWGYSTEATKVIIVGSFLCDPSESVWTCMFGETEVPLEILQEGVIRCEAPPHHPGKVNLCITCGNRESCSEVREFEYRVKTSSSSQYNLYSTEAKSTEELLLMVRFVQMLLSDSPSEQGCGTESGMHLLRKLKGDDDSWNDVIEALLAGNGTSGNGTSSGIIDWLLQELQKDKLQQWLSSRSKEACNQSGCSLSKKEQGIIHMVAGLGFEWALNPILSHGVSINFRDINGWTALHWAACFGREKMVAALIASGASAGAVTDPSSQDPTGKTAASIAASNGHKGLAGYLSELALTSHLSSLTLEESELSKGSAEVMAEMTVNSISKVNTATSEDKHSLKDILAAVRNAALAAARIHNAFRALSFEKRRQREVAAAAAAGVDEYGLHSDEIQRLSAMSKLTFGNARDYNSAALSIQKKYRGWKGRKNFLALRRKVVKIQAHVRGYQVRKHYKVVCRAVSTLEKIILRWRRKGVGLRGFHPETEPNDSSEDEDFLKVFRKQNVYKAIDGALSRVLNMVESPEAREQYRRMLEKYLQAKAKLGDTSEPAASISVEDISDVEADDFF